VFAHQALPEIFFNDPEKFIASIKNEETAFLRYVWKQVGAYIQENDQAAGDSLAAEVLPAGDYQVGLISCPEPLQPTEPHFIAAAYRPEQGEQVSQARYITLELGRSLEGGMYTVLAEWDGDRHIHYGEGPEPEAEAFMNSVKKLTGST